MNIKNIGLLCTFIGGLIFCVGFPNSNTISIIEMVVGLTVFCVGAYIHTKNKIFEPVVNGKGRFVGIKAGTLFIKPKPIKMKKLAFFKKK